jgi:F-box-like
MLNLPAELALVVLAYLPLSSIATLLRVSRHWSSFIGANRDAIYHKAAVWHGFIPSPSTSLEELNLWYSGRSLKGVNTWQDFCTSPWPFANTADANDLPRSEIV